MTMLEIRGNLFEVPADAICITTNGFVTRQGECVMGLGCAKTFKKMYPKAPLVLGAAIKKNGNVVNCLGESKKTGKKFYSFPEKGVREINNGSNVVSHAIGKFYVGSGVPGFYCKARLDIIVKSCKELVAIANEEGLTNIVIPRMGCGAGELTWDEVKPIVSEILDDRFSVITF